jgi:ribosome biogenesis GTPase / thiamine phosphate phosphatase
MTGPDIDSRRAQAAGLVIANHGRMLLVEAADGEVVQCAARRTAGAVVCGDRVAWEPQAHGDAVITAVLPRETLLSRPDPRGKPKLLCANVDRVVVTGALPARGGDDDERGPLNLDLINSYLVAAELLGIDAAIIVNKIDLADVARRARLETQLAPYRAAGYPVVAASAKTGDGFDRLRDLLTGHRSVLVGESGVGKSSLIERLVPGHDIRIGELSRGGGKGRHTTTVAMLFHLADGGDIIDSPGVREFRLWPVEPGELARGFREFREHLGRCRYRDCRHVDEPGCALAAAADRGLIARARLDGYRALLKSRGQST